MLFVHPGKVNISLVQLTAHSLDNPAAILILGYTNLIIQMRKLGISQYFILLAPIYNPATHAVL